jgi:NADPH:quinone reductase-like Zn-dependent oxidoreductase
VRAAILERYGTPPRVADFADPRAAGDRVVVEILAGGLNPVDLRMASGSFHGGSSPLPSVAGREGVGTVSDGALVYFDGAVAPYGSFAERALVERGDLVALPAGIDAALATCFGIAGTAAWMALEWRAQLRAGETVLVLGASGVVGQIAVQAARLLGAVRVVAASRSADGLERALARGADAVVRIGEAENLEAALRDACGDGADVVIDPLWGEPAAAALSACRNGARFVQLGESAGSHASLASALVRGRMLAILGYTSLMAPRDAKRDAYRRMVEHAAAGEFTVDLERVPLEAVGDAWQRAQNSPHRKLVIVPGRRTRSAPQMRAPSPPATSIALPVT